MRKGFAVLLALVVTACGASDRPHPPTDPALATDPPVPSVGTGSASVSTPTAPASVATIKLSEPPDMGIVEFVVATDDAVWVTIPARNMVGQIDPTTDRLVDHLTMAAQPFVMAVDGHDLWVTSDASGLVLHIDLASRRVVASIPVERPSGIALAAGSVWVVEHEHDSVVRIDPATNRVVKTVPVGRGPMRATYADGSLWVQNVFAGTLSRIDPKTNAEVARIDLHTDGAFGVAVTPTAVWAATSGPVGNQDCAVNQLVRIDPATNQELGHMTVPCPMNVAATDESGVWVTGLPLENVYHIDPAMH